MFNGFVKDSPDQCRERRRRRIEKRRRLASAARLNSNRNNNSNDNNVEMANPITDLNLNDSNVNVDVVPVVGTMSVAGRQREMEDTVSVQMNLCLPEINAMRPIHFLAVFDGHGGPHVAALCREKLHMFVRDELLHVDSTSNAAAGGGGGSSSTGVQQQAPPPLQVFMETWERVLKNSFLRMDEVAGDMCDCGSMGYLCDCNPDEVALSGSTAVVAAITHDYIIVANCGDSRAVLCRGGRAIPLSIDHRPDRPDERARIEAAGGRIFINEGPRVEGVLAMSRTIGDNYIKPCVISEPEVSFTRRNADLDECLILGSDGLWDVMTNSMACEVAREGLRAEPANDARSRSASAVALLTRLALGRNSVDNVSGIVVDLKRAQN